MEEQGVLGRPWLWLQAMMGAAPVVVGRLAVAGEDECGPGSGAGAVGARSGAAGHRSARDGTGDAGQRGGGRPVKPGGGGGEP